MSTGRFDDGNREVPGGIAEPVRRVLVVGGGIAGLTVANALHHAGVEYVVLEARGRVGGRLHTRDLAGSPVDLGGSWMLPPSGKPLRRFAREAGVECHPGDPLPTLSAFDVGTRLWLSRDDVEESLTGDLGVSCRPSVRCANVWVRRPPGERRGGRGRCGRAAVAGVDVDPGRVRRRPTSATCLEGGTCPS